MSKSSTPPPPPAAAALNDLAAATAAAGQYAAASRAPTTLSAYESDWAIFTAWCARVGANPLPASPDTLAAFLAAQAQSGLAPSTIGRRRAAIARQHREAQFPCPGDTALVGAVSSGIRRAWKKPPNRKAPAVDTQLRRMVDTRPSDTLAGLRDRAMLLVGFAGALRRSELVALDLEDLTEHPDGLMVRIGGSKTDQEHRGQTIAIRRVPGSRYCPVDALFSWCAAARITHGALFRRIRRGDQLCESRLTDKSVARLVKNCCLHAGLDPSLYSGHSLRRGFLTSAAGKRANLFKMAEQSRHKSLDVLRMYVQDAERFQDHAAHGLLEG